MEEHKAPVSWRSLLQRVNRKLASKAHVLRKSRDGRGRDALGEYYLLDLQTKTIVARHVDPRALATELQILQPWEALVEEEGN